MKDEAKTKEQLLQELNDMRQRVLDDEKRLGEKEGSPPQPGFTLPVAFDRLLTDLATQLAGLTPQESERGITRALQTIGNALGYSQLYLYLVPQVFVTLVSSVDQAEESLVLCAAVGEAGSLIKRWGAAAARPAGYNLITEAALTLQPLVVNDGQHKAQYYPTTRPVDVYSEAAVPLITAQQLVGVLAVQYVGANHFGPQEIHSLNLLATQLASLLTQAEFQARNKRLLDELNLLHAVAATHESSEDALIERVTHLMSNLYNFDNVGIRLLDPDNGNLRDHASYRKRAGSTRSIVITGPGEGITGRVAITGQPWRVADVAQEPAFVGDPDVQSELCVPLKIGDHIIGVINVESVRRNAFTEADERLLITVAGQMGAAIEKIRLLDETQRRAEEKASLLATTKAISSLQVENVLNTIAREAQTLLKADTSRIHLLEPDGETLRCVTVFAEDAEPFFKFYLKVGKGITGCVALSGVPEIIHNSMEDARSILIPGTPDEPEAMVLAPLVVRHQTIGVMTVTRKGTTRPFIPADLTLLTAFADQAAVAIENARLFTAERRQLEELVVLHAVTSAVAEATNEDELLERVTQLVSHSRYPEPFGILLLNETDNMLHPHRSYRGRQTAVSLQHTVAGRVVTTGQPVRLADVRREAAALEIDPRTRSQLCVPLKVGDQIIGAINAESQEPDVFSEADERLLMTFARQLGVAMAKVRLFDVERRRAAQQRTLAEASGAILSALDVESLWQAVGDATRQTLAADRTAVFLYETHTNLFTCVYASKLSDHYITALSHYFQRIMQAQQWPQRQPIAINDIQNQPDNQDLEQRALHEGFHAYAVFPLAAPNELLGGLAVYRDQAVPFTADDLATGQTLAHIVAVALQNVQLFAEKTHALHREQQLNEVTRTLNSALDLPTILASVVRMATELVNADAGVLGLVIDDQIMTFYPYNLPTELALSPAPRGRGVAWHIADSGQSFRLTDYKAHPDAQPRWVAAGIKAFLGVPIITGHVQHLGALMLFHREPGKQFSEREQAVAESIARQAGNAIQNARLYAAVKQRANALAATLAKQEELDRLKDLFVQNVSHELRTPLGIVQGHAELLQSGLMGELQPQQQESVGIITRRVRMLTDLVNDLTALLAAQTQEFRRQEIDPAQLVYSMLADYQLKAEEIGIILKADVQPNLPWVSGDPTHLRRVFDNLVSNAFKFTPMGGTVSMRLWREGTDVIIEVSDTGIGIPQEQLERIFERFYQVDGSPTRRFGGTGLGLALVKEIVEAHRGHVSVRSQVNEGSTFEITLPGFEPEPVADNWR